jgi:hypothetical protein
MHELPKWDDQPEVKVNSPVDKPVPEGIVIINNLKFGV